MKTFVTAFICLMLSMHSTTFAKEAAKSTIGFKELVGRLDSGLVERIDSRYASAQLTHFKVGQKHIEFRLSRLPIYIEWVGSSRVLLTINGTPFSPSEMKNTKSIRLALIQKFNLKTKKWSFWSFLFPDASAQVQTSKLLGQFLDKALTSARSGGLYNLGVLVAAMGGPQAEAFVFVMSLVAGGFGNFMGQASAAPTFKPPVLVPQPSFMVD